MLESIHLKNVGPADEMKMRLASRLNLVTGDNGLGKTLLLDSMWWALTRTWPLTWGGNGVVPEKEAAAIEWVEQHDDGAVITKSIYDFDDAGWKTTEQAPRADAHGGGLVVYMRVDGGISVHDPLRTGEGFKRPAGVHTYGRSHSFQFTERNIWDGLALVEGGKLVAEGLVRDVGRWALESGSAEFEQIAALIEQLAGEERFRLTRKLERVYVDDPRDFPVVAGPAGELPIAHAPAGLRRILGLAYLVVWAWREHKIAAGLKKRAPTSSLVLLIDEIESHLHPKWQRTILPSLLRALNDEVKLQVVATTHSPMVLASVEPVFDVKTDKLFLLDLEDNVVAFHEKPWVMQGDVINWLVSDTFGLQQARSLEAEHAIEAAEAWMRNDTTALPLDLTTKESIHKELVRLLPGHDPFWPRWIVRYEKPEGA